MTNSLLLFTLLLASLASGPATAAESRAVTPEHRAVLDAYRTALVEAYVSARPQAAVGALAESAQLMPAYQKSVLGKKDAAIYYRAFLQRFSVSAYQRVPLEVADLGSQVLEIGRFTMTLARRGSGDSQTISGKYLDLWQKSPTGALALLTAAWNHDGWPKDAEDFRFAEVPGVHVALQPRVPLAAGIALEIAAIQKLQESIIVQHDGKAWALFYADDAILLANQGGVVSGRQALDAYTIEHAKGFPVFEKLDLRTQRIDDLGEYVIEYASAVVNWRVNESTGVTLGKNILVWRRDAGGTLKIWRAISMYD